MDFLNPAKKRAHRNRLIVGYILIAIAIGLVTTILVFQSYGYDLDRKTGAIIQNGLVFVAAQPEAASIYLNNKQYTNQGNARLVLPSDVYKLELKRDGYRDWYRTFSLAGGTIERLTYPFLFPVNLNTQNRKVYTSSPAFASQSPDRRWILVQRPGQWEVFDVFDANDAEKEPTAITLPTGLMAASSRHQLQLIEWSTDNRHLLVRHDFDGGHEFIVIDHEAPSQSFNVNKTFNRNPSQVTLRDKRFDHFYLYDQATKKLDYAELKTPTAIQPILDNVLSYKTHGDDMILYVTDQQASAGKARVMLKDKDSSYPVREVALSPTYQLALARYDNAWFVAGGATTEGRVYVYKNPLDTVKQASAEPLIPVSVLRVNNPEWLEFSANTQFIALQGGQQFAVYDAENERDYRYEIKEPLDLQSPRVSWMDGHRLIINSAGSMVVFDYDGINVQTITENLAGMPAFFDRDYKLLYNIRRAISPDRPDSLDYALTRTDLLVKN